MEIGANGPIPPPKASAHPVDVGLRTEAAILAELVRRGYEVLVPFGTNQRYDRSSETAPNSPSSAGEIELFLVFCPETGGIYAVPVDEAPEGYGSLRINPTRSGQTERIRWARDYELPG
jgi:PD-(D/E)XK endonuclease